MRLFAPALLLFALGCSSDSTAGDDASTPDATTSDAVADVQKIDAKSDATIFDAATDAGAEDVTIIDAADDVAIDDAASDAADDASTIEAGTTDGGKKNCLGVFCIQGYKCCNVLQSQNYGTCQPQACLTCCQ